MSEIRKVLLAGVAYAGINLAVTFLLRNRDKRTVELEGALKESDKKRTVAEAKLAAADPNNQPIPWEEAKQELDRVAELEGALRGIASTANANKHMHEEALRHTLEFIEEEAQRVLAKEGGEE